MAADPGLVRRFPTALHLEDYTPSQLAAIARQVTLTPTLTPTPTPDPYP